MPGPERPWSPFALSGCAMPPPASEPVGTGDLGVIIERATGKVAIINSSQMAILGEVAGLGDLSHASVVFSRDERYAFVFGRDGALSKVNILTRKLRSRVMQSRQQHRRRHVARRSLCSRAELDPGGVKVFDARTLELVADIPAESTPQASCRAWSGWSMPPMWARASDSCSRCSMPTKSGLPMYQVPAKHLEFKKNPADRTPALRRIDFA